MGQIVAVNVGRAAGASWAGSHGKPGRTAIDKRPVDGPVMIGRLGVAGDEQADTANHGGVDQAVYAYAREDLDWWERELGRDLPAGVFGENLTLAGVDVNGALIGERWRLGTVLLEVTSPRVPCGTFRGWMNEKGWVKRFTQAERTGAYLRVLAEGSVTAGDPVEVDYRPAESITVTESFRAFHGDQELMRRLLAVPGLGAKWSPIADQVLRDPS